MVGDGDDSIDDDAHQGQPSMSAATSASMSAPSMTGPSYNPSILEGLGALLVDALQQPQVSIADNEAGPSTCPYSGLTYKWFGDVVYDRY